MKLQIKTIVPLLATGILAGAAGYALANNISDHSGHNANSLQSASIPTEPGQSGFAAIEEIVAMLENDPDTDWSRVNIDALREHLVDMDALTMGANVSIQSDNSSVTFVASGTGSALRALHAMVPAHANELDKMKEWSASGEKTPDGAILTIKPADNADLQKVKALGFFGLMATGGHHQPHHLGMASGKMVH